MSPFLLTTIIFSAAYFLLVLYFLAGWLRLPSPAVNPQSRQGGKRTFVSIVVPVRNESENIQTCLESIFKQSYPAELFEVLVIDDFSTDPTLRLAKELERPNLTVLDLQQYLGDPGEYVPNKKKALALGIKNAKGELIITTDGDCHMNENWLQTMVEFYEANNYKLVTGPVMVKPAKGPFSVFQQLDVINLLGVTGATIRNNFPVMCNGANLMYSKTTFHEVEGFKGNHDMPTGDDIFLMRKIDDKFDNAVGFVKNFDACVFTKPEKGFSNFVSQRMRWLSKSKRFGDFRISAMLYFVYFFNVLILIDTLNLVSPTEMNWLPLAIAGGTKFFADLLFNIPVTAFFRKGLLLLLLPVIEVFYTLYIAFIGLASLYGHYRWKDREIG